MSNATNQAAKAPFLPTMRALVRTYQAFSAFSETHIRQFDLTPSQFDVIATLGNTEGLSMGEIGDRTLITKGTLTGVIDRLIKKDLVRRYTPDDDRRSVFIQLTPQGETLFETVFPAHITHLQDRFDRLDASELELLKVLLTRLQQTF